MHEPTPDSVESLTEEVDLATLDGLTLKEQIFARLVVEGGLTYKDAYRQAFKPSTEKDSSLEQMGSRCARRQRVVNEIKRLELKVNEESRKQEKHLAIALDGEAVRRRIAIELYTIAFGESKAAIKIRAMQMLGSMKHVDAFMSSTSAGAAAEQGRFGVKSTDTLEEAQANLMHNLGALIGSRVAQKTVDIQIDGEVES